MANYRNKKKYTTIALKDNQYLKLVSNSIYEYYCHGFTNDKPDSSLDGWYFPEELKVISEK